MTRPAVLAIKLPSAYNHTVEVRGTRIGHFLIEDTLGSGGMGTVYRAWDEVLERRVALKCIRPGKEHSEERRERLRREARSAAGLDHPTIARVYDFFQEGGVDHIVMELVEGQPLSTVLLRAPLAPTEALGIARQICEGLAAAHARGIVHRDLKAENVMVTEGGKVKILDFGLAKRLEADEDSLTQDGIVMGTSRAMSPEQARGKPVDHRSDLFSLGSLLYEMLSGRHPFQAGSPLETMRRVVRNTPRPLAELQPDLPQELCLLVEGLLEKNPDRRPQTAGEVVAALETVESFWATSTTDQTSLARLAATQRRRRLVRRWWAPALVAAVFLVAGGLYRAYSRPPAPPILVVVPNPQVLPVDAPSEALRAAGLVRVALCQAVASARGLATPDPLVLSGITGTPSELARAAGAGEALAATLEVRDTTYQITVRRLDPTGHLLWTNSTVSPRDETATLVQVAHSLAAAAYPGRIPSGLTAPPEAFSAYARLAALNNDPSPGLTKAELLQQVSALTDRQPALLEGQILKASLARYVYETSRDEQALRSAQTAVQQALGLAPDDPRALSAAIDVANVAGDTKSVEKLLQRLETVAPGSPAALSQRASLLQSQGRLEEAIGSYRRLASVYPSWLAFWQLANAQIHNADSKGARTAIEHGLERAPDNRYLLAQLAQLELYFGDLEHAAELYRRLSDSYQSSVYTSNLGFAQMLRGRYDEAEVAFRKALKLAPGDCTAVLNLADTLELKGQHAAGADAYRQALEMASAPGVPEDEALGVRAQCLAHLGRGAEAVAAVQELLRLGPDNPNNLLCAAVTYAVVGEKLSAKTILERAIQQGLNRRWAELPWFRGLLTD